MAGLNLYACRFTRSSHLPGVTVGASQLTRMFAINISKSLLTRTVYGSKLRNMSNSKTINTDSLAEMFKALGNQHRLAILLRLATCCPPGTKCVSASEARLFVGRLGEDLDISGSTLSHHIKELRQAGLVKVERKGKNIECWVDREALKALAELFSGLLSEEADTDQSGSDQSQCAKCSR
jgi:DNA-binding transcriptional ArsR family regulator